MKKPKLWYGYWIVAVTFLCMFLRGGAAYYPFPLFLKPLQTEFGWGRGTISAALTIYFTMQSLVVPFVGRIVDRYGARTIITLGSLISGLGFLWLTFMQNLWSFYGSYAVIGLGMTAMGPLPTTKVVSNWFIKRRGFTIGIMATGVGVGAFILAPVIGSYLIPNFGWRASYLALALLTWVLIIPIALLVIKERPADIGLYPDGAETPKAATETTLSSRDAEGWTLGMALKTSAFWLIIVAFITGNFSHSGAIQHQANHITDIGFPVAAAAVALGAVGLGSAIGKFGFGWLCDQISAKYAAAISFALQIGAIIVLMSVKPASPLAVIWLYAILLGAGAGGWLPTMSMLVSTNFGLASYGAIFGAISLPENLGTAFGPLAAGLMFDAMQTYWWVFVMLLVLYMVATASVLAVHRPKFNLASSS